MPDPERKFKAKGGTIFRWNPDDPATNIVITVDEDHLVYVNCDEEDGAVIKIPGADLDEFVAHIVSTAVADTFKALLFPSVRPRPPKDAA